MNIILLMPFWAYLLEVNQKMKKVISGIVAALLAVAMVAGLFACKKKDDSGKLGLLTGGKLTIGSEIGYPPFEIFEDDGVTPTGLDIELGRLIAKELGLEATFINTGFDGILGGINAKKYDIVMSALTITPDRQDEVDFSTPYIENWQAIVVLKTSEKVTSPAELAGRKVVYQIGTTSEYYIDDLITAGSLPADLERNAYDKVINCFDELVNGRADAVVVDSVVADGYVAREPDKYEISWIQSTDAGAEPELFGIAISKDNKALYDAINEVLAKFDKDGTLDKLRSEWLS
ncbi:MAG: ABC transporter substrate-binding protein [Oscillospiraceae bacterium]|jgi:polar amino acid transport system substrate-binding protein|nr:ABC transporter substrate-binding protein [Oscillospiraceae bacterium]